MFTLAADASAGSIGGSAGTGGGNAAEPFVLRGLELPLDVGALLPPASGELTPTTAELALADPLRSRFPPAGFPLPFAL